MAKDVIIKNFGGEDFIYGFERDIVNYIVDELIDVGRSVESEEREKLIAFYSDFYKEVSKFHEDTFLVAHCLNYPNNVLRSVKVMDT